jgi:hypothetical protein
VAHFSVEKPAQFCVETNTPMTAASKIADRIFIIPIS